MRELVIDLAAIRHNYQTIRARVAPAMVMGVVKANGYGHGIVEVARVLESEGIDYLGVAEIPEALELRLAGVKTPVLTWLHDPTEDFVNAIAQNVDLGVSNLEQLERIALAAAQVGQPARLHLKLDTGLGRNGAAPTEWPALFSRVLELVEQNLAVAVAIFSHLSCTSAEDDRAQIALFNSAYQAAEAAGLAGLIRHLTASDGSISYPEAHFDMVRIGVSIYGLSPFTNHTSADYGLKPAMTARAQVVQVKRVGANHGVSYGYLHRTSTESTLALVPVGYAEGLPRDTSCHAEVSISGHRVKIQSRIAMDQFVLDVGDLPVAVGDWVTIFGDPASGVPSADDLARAGDTINYEIVTRMGGRFRRVYIDSGAS